MKIFLYITILFFTASNVFSQVEEKVFYTEEELAKTENPVTVVSSSRVPCKSTQKKLKCERIMLFEKSSGKLHILFLDGRSKNNDKFDINYALANPDKYDGQIETYNLFLEFDSDSEITSISVIVKKGKGPLSFEVKLIQNGAKAKKIFSSNIF